MQAELAEDEQRFLSYVRRNRCNAELLERLPALNVPDCYLVSGCLFQTVWNCLTGKQPGADILDYDVFYYDAADLSWEAEDAVIRRVREAFTDLGIEVQVRNQARVHLWYGDKFGLECAPLRSARDGIDHFLVRAACLGITQRAGVTEVYAPFGFDELFAMTVRPNCRRNLPAVYYAKAKRWQEAWPELTVVPWPA